MSRPLVAICVAFGLAAGCPAVVSAQSGTTWDNLVQVKSKVMRKVFLAPGADFKHYTKIMIEPTEVAFEKNFIRDYNSSASGLSRRITERDAAKGLEQVKASFEAIFAKAFTDSGYTVVTQPGPDVLMVRTAVLNLYVNAPDIQSAGRSRSFAPEAGRASLVLEARDSSTHALLGRAVDAKLAGDMGGFMAGSMRTSVSNRADFEQVFKTWAKASVKGLNTLKTTPNPAG